MSSTEKESEFKVYSELSQAVGHTPLTEICNIKIPGHNNRIFMKHEWLNPSGSHYDRVYLKLLQGLEHEGRIHRGITPLIEVSSGSAGCSFAWLAARVGYEATVVVPHEIPKSRVNTIQRYGANIVTASNDYVAGAVDVLQSILAKNAYEEPDRSRRLFCVNHSQDFRSVVAMRDVGVETALQCRHANVTPDFFVGVFGNGTTLLGFGGELKRLFPHLRVISCEPEECSPAYDRNNGIRVGRYERHDVFGAGVWNVHFPFLVHPDFERSVDDYMMVSANNRKQTLDLLHHVEGEFVGRSTAMSLSSALRICEENHNSTVIIQVYDSFDRYK